MIDAYDLYLSFQSTVNTFQGGWYRPNTDFIRKCNDLSKKFWNKWTAEAGKSQEAKDNLSTFFKSKNFIVSNKGIYGTFKPDNDYGRFCAARIIVNGDRCLPDQEREWADICKEEGKKFQSQEQITEEYYDNVKQFDVELIDNIRWGSVNEHMTKPPTVKKPKIRQITNGFEVAPRTVSVIVLDYFREPVEATFNYDITPGNVQTGAGGQLIYDKKNSQPLEWPFNVRDEFLIGLGEAYGVFTRDQFVTQVNLTKKTA